MNSWCVLGVKWSPLLARLLIFGIRLISLGEYYACIIITRVAIFNEYEKKEERYWSNACRKCRFAKVLWGRNRRRENQARVACGLRSFTDSYLYIGKSFLPIKRLYLLVGVGCNTSILWTEFRCKNNSLLSSRLATCGMGWAMVDLKTIASASESQIPDGSCVTAIRVPSKP